MINLFRYGLNKPKRMFYRNWKTRYNLIAYKIKRDEIQYYWNTKLVNRSVCYWLTAFDYWNTTDRGPEALPCRWALWERSKGRSADIRKGSRYQFPGSAPSSSKSGFHSNRLFSPPFLSRYHPPWNFTPLKLDSLLPAFGTPTVGVRLFLPRSSTSKIGFTIFFGWFKLK